MGSGILKRLEKAEAKAAPDMRPVIIWKGTPIPDTDRPVIIVSWQEDEGDA
jgi:hypothetical protein